MVKKSGKTPSSKAAEASSTCDWVATGILSASDSNPNSMKEEKLAEIRMLFNGNVVCVLPDQNVAADWYRSGWVSFHCYPFEIGVRFPFSQLVSDFLTELNVSPGQLMASTWRVLACLDSIEEKHSFGINVEVVRQCYTTKKYGGGRYGLVSKKKDDPLILNLEMVHDRGWKDEFFFVEKASLGTEGQSLREKWNNDVHYFGTDVEDPIALSIIEKITALPGKERLWPNCLGRAIRHAAPIDVEKYFGKLGSKAVVKYDPIVSDKSTAKTAAGRTRSKRALSIGTPMVAGSPSKSLHSISSESNEDPKLEKGIESAVSRQLAKEFKSPNLLDFNISSKDLFSIKRCRDDKSTETESSKAVSLVSPVPKRVKIVEDQSIVARKGTVAQSVTVAQYGVEVEPIKFAPSLEGFLLPQTVEAHSSKDVDLLIDETIGNAYHTFQDALMLRQTHRTEMKRLLDVEMEHKSCNDKLRITQARAADLSKRLKVLQTEFDEYREQSSVMLARFAKDSEEAIKHHIMRTRAEMMLEYRNGESSSWPVDETITEYNEKYPERALSLNAGDDSEHQVPDDEVQHVGDDEDVEEESAQEDVQDDGPDGAPGDK